MKLATMKRAGALGALALLLSCFAGPIVAAADSWYGSVMQDQNHYADVHVKVCDGCGSALQATYLQDKTSASPAPVNAPNGENVGLWNNSQLQVKHSGLGVDVVETCPNSGSSSGDNGAICVAGWGSENDIAVNVSASANQTWTANLTDSNGAGKFGAHTVTLCLSASAATTFNVQESIDRTIFYGATIDGTATSANFAPTGAGSICEKISPATAVKITTTAAVTVSLQAMVGY